MGKRVSRSGQLSKSQCLISCAVERQRDVYSTAMEAFVNDVLLSGDAYTNAKDYVGKILLPVSKAFCIAIESEIEANIRVIDSCNTYLIGVDLLDEETLLAEISRLENKIRTLQDEWWDYLSIINPILITHYKSQIHELNTQLEKLEAYDNATKCEHNNANSEMSFVSKKIGSIVSATVFLGSRFNYSNIDMSWSDSYLIRWKSFIPTNLSDIQVILKIAEKENVTYEHARILYYAQKWDVDEVAWSNQDIIIWKTYGGDEYLFDKKREFVRNYADVIRDAAKEYDLPEWLLAGIAYTEYGGDPLWIDNVAYNVRSFDWSGPDWVDKNLTITEHPDFTSFGNTSIQVRRAIEMLEYDSYTDSQKDTVIKSLEDPVQNIYMAAKHLDVLRNVDYYGVPASELSEKDIQSIASRYNLGPEISKEKAIEWSYGKSVINNRSNIMEALGDEE